MECGGGDGGGGGGEWSVGQIHMNDSLEQLLHFVTKRN